MNKVLNMTFESSLTEICEVNSSFDSGVLRVCYTGQNRNGSSISREAIERSLPTIYNCPVVCNYDRDTDSLGGHDMELVRGADGDLRIVNSTQPVGVIPESAKTWFEDYTEEDGTVHEYLYTEVLLWKRQEAYKKIKDDGITAHSMEITVKDGRTSKKVFHINDFEFTAFCLISEEPCFEGSALETFSMGDFKEQFSLMMQDYKQAFSMVTTQDGIDDTHPETFTEGGEEILDSKVDLTSEYVVDGDKLSFITDSITMTEQSDAEDPVSSDEDSVNESEEGSEDFALLHNIVEEIQSALASELIPTDIGDRPHYCYVDCDLDAHEVYGWDICDWLLYGFTFSEDGDHIVIDFESKKRKKYVIADFDEGEQESPFAYAYDQMKQKIQEYAAKEDEYKRASSELESVRTELTQLRAFKKNAEDTAALCQRENMMDQFDDLTGNEDFEALRKDCMKYDLATLEDKCYAIRGRNMKSLKFSVESKATKLPVEKTTDPDEPYGGLFQKYAVGSE